MNKNTQALQVAMQNASQFSAEFLSFLPANLHIYEAFELQAHRAISQGRKHYSSKTIIEFLRHHTAMTERDSEFKLNNNTTPGLARLFGLMNPANADLFSFRVCKSVRKESA